MLHVKREGKMNIKSTQNATAPSFQAKLKNNDITKKVVNKMDNNQMAEFKTALKDFSKVSPNDVVEISKDT